MQQPTLSGIGALFRERARIDRSAVALLEGDRQISYGELNDRVNRLVHVFAGYGLGNGAVSYTHLTLPTNREV